MSTRTSKSLAALAVLAVVTSGGITACTPDFASDSQASVILKITKITGESGEDQEEGDFLNSDVFPVFNDNAVLDFLLQSKNPTTTAGPHEAVFLERYEVRYFRSDGRNTEGVDVPYRITGPLATLVEPDAGASAAIVVVRHQAKEEPPLRNLRFNAGLGTGGGHDLLTVIAEITVHGQTGSRKGVSAVGRLQINFADFADN